MAEESPLANAAELYSPFDTDEVRRLQTYVRDTETLMSMSFFTNPGRGLTIEGGDDQPLTVKLIDIDDEAVRAVVPLFRSLYVPNEPTSYRRTLNLLKRHLRESPRRETALRELRKFGPWEKEVLNNSAMSIVRNGVRMTANEIVELYMHGQYLHKDPERSKQLDALSPMDEALRGEFLRAIQLLGHVYYIMRNVVTPILEAPSLLPAASARDVA